MIQTAKAYAAQPDVAAKLKEFKVVSTGEDVPAQISAINNFIDSGYDAIVVNAQNPTAFAPVIKRAKDAGVVLVAFDNILDTEDAINVNVDQKGLGKLLGRMAGQARARTAARCSKCAASPAPRSTRDRHDGIHEMFEASGKKWDVVEVIGKWDDPTAQKVTADAIAVHKKFDGITAQGGDTGVVQAMIDAKHPFVPFGGETENGFRKFCAKYAGEGLKCSSAGTGPAQVAVAIKTAIAALEGKVVPQSVKLPLAIVEDPNFKEGAGLLPRPVRQLLRRQLLPDLRHQLHRAGNHGADRRRTSKRGCGSAPRSVRGADLATASPGGVRDDGGGTALPHGGRLQALWRRARAGGRRARGRGRPHPRHPGRERRRQVHADQDHGGRRRARRGPHAARRRSRSRFASPAAANAAGIACIFQELSLIPDLSVADNIVITQPAAPLRH